MVSICENIYFSLYLPDMPRNLKLIGLSQKNWKKEVDYLKTFAKKRHSYIKSQAKSYFKLSKSDMEKYFG